MDGLNLGIAMLTLPVRGAISQACLASIAQHNRDAFTTEIRDLEGSVTRVSPRIYRKDQIMRIDPLHKNLRDPDGGSVRGVENSLFTIGDEQVVVAIPFNHLSLQFDELEVFSSPTGDEAKTSGTMFNPSCRQRLTGRIDMVTEEDFRIRIDGERRQYRLLTKSEVEDKGLYMTDFHVGDHVELGVNAETSELEVIAIMTQPPQGCSCAPTPAPSYEPEA